MSLIGAMFSSVSALNAHSSALGMISDNIANVSTIGYKATHASFSSLVTPQGTNFYSAGGTRAVPLSAIDRQGLLQASESNTDLAISGQGFFVVTQNNSPTAADPRFYTRAGEFSTDTQGFLKTPSGYYLQGWKTDANGEPLAGNTSIVTALEPVRVSGGAGAATVTSNIEFDLNLPASVAVGDTQSTTVQVFDSLGVGHDVTLTWEKTAANEWTVTATAPDATSVDENAVGGNAGWSVDIVFNGDGTPLTFDGGATPPALALGGWTSGANDTVMNINLGTPNETGGVTQFSSNYSVTGVNQDGRPVGTFFGVNVDQNGIVSALFDNGESLKMYKLPLATFANPNGLEAKNGSVYAETDLSGGVFLRSAADINSGTIVTNSVEASTVDLAQEFTDMIITQRAYSANTRIITTADQMMEELLRIR